ncbi:MAG: tetratricopeptide repeat protein, partial [Armatimonadota bacterium]
MTGYRKVKAFLSAVLTALVVSACAAVRPGAALGPSVILWMSAGADTPQQPVLSAIAEAIPGCEVSVLQPGSPGIRRCAAEGRLRAERLATPSADDLAEVGLQMGGRVVVHLPASPGGAYIVVDAVGRDAVRVAGDAAADRLGPAVSAFFGRRPATAGEFYRLGRILLACNDAAGAVDALSDAVALAPAVAEYRGWLLRALVSAGRLGEAEHQAKRALKVGRTDPTALMAAAELECVRGRWTQALALAERASALDDPPPGVHRLLGDICTALGRTLRAVEEYRLAKDDPAACTALAALLMKQGQFDEAATAAQAALASEPENVRAKELLANAYSGAERYADAVRQRSL